MEGSIQWMDYDTQECQTDSCKQHEKYQGEDKMWIPLKGDEQEEK